MITSIIITNNNNDHIKDCISNIRKITHNGTYEIIVVDNNSSEEIKEWLSEQIDVKTYYSEETLNLAESWNKGLKIVTGDNVVFLRSDIIVLNEWLVSMLQILYHNEQIAAVGGSPILENKDWSYKLTLADYCILFRKRIFEVVGEFDEKLEDNEVIIDYSLRCIKSGFQLAECNHVIEPIHETSNIHYHYRMDLFKEKWGITSKSIIRKARTLSLIDKEEQETICVLEVGCGYGRNLIELNYKYPNAELHAIEIVEEAAEIASKLAIVKTGNIERYINQFENDYFDFVLINQSYFNINLDWVKILLEIKRSLKPDGKILVEIDNINSFKIVRNILQGILTEEMKMGFILSEIVNLFERAEFAELHIDYVHSNLSNEEIQFINAIENIVPYKKLPEEFLISNFLLTIRKSLEHDSLHDKFDYLLENPQDQDLTVEEILALSTDRVLLSVDSYSGPIVPLLNLLALYYFERNFSETAIHLLMKAYEYDEENSTTVLNIGTIMYRLGNEEAALDWFKRLSVKGTQVELWIKKIENDKDARKKLLKFLILRIEYNIDYDLTIEKFVDLINDIELKEILYIIEHDIIEKEATLNRIALVLYNNNKNDWALSLLNKALKYNSRNDHTLINIGYILMNLKKYKEALSFFKLVSKPDQRILYLIEQLERLIGGL